MAALPFPDPHRLALDIEIEADRQEDLEDELDEELLDEDEECLEDEIEAFLRDGGELPF